MPPPDEMMLDQLFAGSGSGLWAGHVHRVYSGEMYSGPALREFTVYGQAGQATGNFNSVLKGDLGIRMGHWVGQRSARHCRVKETV